MPEMFPARSLLAVRIAHAGEAEGWTPRFTRTAFAAQFGKGADIDLKKTYTLATTDYLYLGGDGFKLHEADKTPTQTKVSWQSALIEWTKGKKSDEKKPLETLLPK